MTSKKIIIEIKIFKKYLHHLLIDQCLFLNLEFEFSFLHFFVSKIRN